MTSKHNIDGMKRQETEFILYIILSLASCLSDLDSLPINVFELNCVENMGTTWRDRVPRMCFVWLCVCSHKLKETRLSFQTPESIYQRSSITSNKRLMSRGIIMRITTVKYTYQSWYQCAFTVTLRHINCITASRLYVLLQDNLKWMLAHWNLKSQARAKTPLDLITQ